MCGARANGESAISPVTQKLEQKVIRIGRGWLSCYDMHRRHASELGIHLHHYANMFMVLWIRGPSFYDVHARGDNRGQLILIEVWNHRLMRDWQISCQECQIDFTDSRTHEQVSIEFFCPAHVAIITCNLEV